ncbi:MAG: hypothetical protein AAF449_16675, partial [Myxococcota bacterium]
MAKRFSSVRGGLRRLTQLEELFYYVSHSVENGCSSDVIVLDGKLDLVILKEALERWSKRHPVLQSVIVRRSFGRVYWKPLETPLPLPIHVHSLSTDDPEQVEAHLASLAWGMPIDVERELPVRFHYTETNGRCYLQVVTSRVFNDGQTGDLITREITEAYQSIFESKAYDDTPRDMAVKDNSIYLEQLSWKKRLQLWIDGLGEVFGDIFTSDRSLKLDVRPSKVRSPRVRRVELGAERLSSLKIAARSRSVTV